MHGGRRRGRSEGVNAWPGWVDALSSLIMVIIFLLMVFVVGQFYLSQMLTGRDQALGLLDRKVAELNALLGAERLANAALRQELDSTTTHLNTSTRDRERQLRELASLQADLQALRQARERLEADLAALALVKQAVESQASAEQQKLAETLRQQTETLRQRDDALRQQTETLRLSAEQRRLLLAELETLRDRSKALETRLADQGERTRLAQSEIAQRDIRLQELLATVAAREGAIKTEQDISAAAQARVAALGAELQALREQLGRAAAALEQAEHQGAAQKTQIDDLSGRLTAALASKVEELRRYRSEFFGRLRETIGTRPDIRIVGDRFVFQSEVLFSSGSAVLEEGGKAQLASLARTLMDIARQIPADVPWILRVDGHTDRRPIATLQFHSNWELSTARAISVVRFLVEQGIPASRLAATGFGEFQPLEQGASAPVGLDPLARDRRIELKLDQR